MSRPLIRSGQWSQTAMLSHNLPIVFSGDLHWMPKGNELGAPFGLVWA